MDLQKIQDAIRAGHILAGGHAAREAAADGVTLAEVWAGILSNSAEVIEDYPTDRRGPSCLIYCRVLGEAHHAVVAYPSLPQAQQRGYTALAFLITCYRPGGAQHAAKWSADFKKRVQP
ncbi:MAG: DUF4258 domain-containing protein [Ktedonobacterales bacterium]